MAAKHFQTHYLFLKVFLLYTLDDACSASLKSATVIGSITGILS